MLTPRRLSCATGEAGEIPTHEDEDRKHQIGRNETMVKQKNYKSARILMGCIGIIEKEVSDAKFGKDIHWKNASGELGLSEVKCRKSADILISSLPEMLEALTDILVDDVETNRNKIAAEAAINYALMPFDIFPVDDEKLGKYSLLDDALIVLGCINLILDDCPPTLRKLVEKLGPHADMLNEGLFHSVKEEMEKALDNLITLLKGISE
ncbi:MAG: hypothetical protein JJU11_18205 [Candidatus Sumerlaeia bacterium]|nr:hypothetical protein [Candidatus Sumerlaeia bacterium]